MSRLERLKTEIAFHEKMFFASIAAMLAMTGWLTTAYKTADTWLVLLAVLGLAGSSAFGLSQYRHIKKLLLELEEC